jgi:hypothetical protein
METEGKQIGRKIKWKKEEEIQIQYISSQYMRRHVPVGKIVVNYPEIEEYYLLESDEAV